MADTLCCVNLDVGEVFGICIMAKFLIIFFRRYFWLKYMLALQLYIFLFRSSYLWMCPLPVLTIFRGGFQVVFSIINRNIYFYKHFLL